MALLNNLYIFVEKESVGRSVQSTSHSVEKGIDITDSIQKQPIELSISGKIVNSGNHEAAYILSEIISLQNSGSLITYEGRNVIKNLQIQSFDTDHPNTVWGGMEFSMKLKEVRIAQPSYKKKTSKSSKSAKSTESAKKTQAAKKSNPVLKKGATVVFKGGNVYISSSASTPAAKRGRSTCEITQPVNNNKHPVHLISKDKGKVYGWVDKANIEGTGSSETKSKTNAGTQQVTQGNKTAVYHTTKKGDTVYNLVTNKYKSLGKSVKWVVDNNPKAFGTKGDPKTLKIGVKLLMGYKQ